MMSIVDSIDNLTVRRDKLKLLLEIRELTNELGESAIAIAAPCPSPDDGGSLSVAMSALTLATARAEANGWNPKSNDVEEDDDAVVGDADNVDKVVLRNFKTGFDKFFQFHRSKYVVLKNGKERLRYGSSSLLMDAFNLAHPDCFCMMPPYLDNKPFYKQLAIKASQKAANLATAK